MAADRGDDTYNFGSAFSDDDDFDSPEATSAYANPFADGTSPFSAFPRSDDNTPTHDFSGGGHASQNGTARSGPRLNMNMGNIDPGTIAPALGVYTRPSAGRRDGLDYVFAEDYKSARKKSGPEQLTYLAGSAYLTGAVIGGVVGLRTAMQESAGKTGRLRINAILNATGKRGALLANSMGILALVFSLSETSLHNFTKDDGATNYAAAGALAGAIFKSTRGLPVAAMWAAGGAAVAVGAVYASREGIYGRNLQGIL